MGELLSSLDVVNKAFKKSMRGYDPAEVDEFLDRVAESIQAYVQQAKEFERVMEDQAEKLSDYERIKSSLHEALLMAQRTAEEKIANASKTADERISSAKTTADDIVAEARVQAERLVQDAEASVTRHGEELKKLQQLREHAFDKIKAFAGDIRGVVDGAESGWGINIPDFTRDVMNRSEARNRAAESARYSPQPGQPEADSMTGTAPLDASASAAPQQTAEEKKQEISDTLNVLGIDPNLLDTDSSSV